jgi:ABC-type multidrug transport system ATPase subunit
VEASITFKAVGKTIRNKTLLADLSFGVEKGSTFVLIGESGSGKSIILKLLVGLIEKDTGSVYVQGQDTSTRSTETRSICGYMPQIINLDDEITIMENLSIYGQLHGLTSVKAINNTLYWAEILGFTQFLKQYHNKLAYGFQRKVLFARALVHDPEVLLLDEPTIGMDPHSRSVVWDVLDKLHKSKTILFATQNFAEAERYADRIAILHEGNIKMDGSLERLIETTHGLTRYRLVFSEKPPEEFMIKLEQYPRVQRAHLKGLELEFYSRERKQFFNVLKLALNYSLSDMDTSICSLRDLYLGLTEGGLE